MVCFQEVFNSMRRPDFPVAAVVVAALLIGLLSACVRSDTYEFKGGEIRPASQAPAIGLTDQFGEPFDLAGLEDNVALVYFGYTTCPDLCPTTLSDFTVVKRLLKDKSDDVRFIMVTVDPERDTPERLEQYLGFFDPDFIGLSGSVDEIEAVKSGYGVVATKVEYPESATGYLVDHTSLIYVIDADGNLRLTYPYGFDPEAIAEDVRHLV
jgi:protein SCO1